MECVKDFYLHNYKFKHCSKFDENILNTGICIYEVLKVEKGLPIFLEEHLNRLFDSGDISRLNINESYCDIETLISELIKKNNAQTGKIKIIIRFEATRGKTEKDLIIYFTEHTAPSKSHYEKGIIVGICDAVRLNPNAKIYNTEARLKANEKILKEELFEVLLLNNEGYLTEGSRSNAFFIKNNTVITPPETEALNGITRQKIVDICLQNNIQLNIEKVKYSDIKNMDSLFLTGTSIKVMPVGKLGDKLFNTKNETLRKVMDLYNSSIEDYLNSKA